MTCVAFARQPRASKPTVAKSDARYFDLTWFPTPDPGQHWVAARREQLAAIGANPDKAPAAEALHDGGRRGRRRRQSTGADYSSLSLATETSTPLRERFPLMLPPRPYCSNDPRNEGVRIRHRDIALRHRHIQLNGPNVVRFLSFDVDRNDAFFAAEDGNLPPPNFVAVNMQPGPREGHAHLGYLLAVPVQKFAMSRRGPLIKACAVERGMRRRLGADPAFSGLLIKNPLHADWRVTWVHDHAYTLDELGEYLFAHDTRRDPRREVRGLSRDCDTFDHTRYRAYANVLEFKRKGDTEAAWVEQCRVVAAEYNEANCTPPLTLGEIRKTGTSVGRWTWRRFTENGFARRQAHRGRSGMAMRWAGHVSAEKAKPWEAEGISRATWYRRKAAAGHVQPVQIHRETITISDDSAQALGGGQPAPGRQPLTAEALAALTVSDRLAA